MERHIPETMRAAVAFGSGTLRVVDRPVPRPGPGEVLVKVAACAICGSDPPILSHPLRGQPPFGEFTPGHEWAGIVMAMGDTVDEFRVGDRVAAQAHRGCIRCWSSRDGDAVLGDHKGARVLLGFRRLSVAEGRA